jgi:hypothetical protein
MGLAHINWIKMMLVMQACRSGQNAACRQELFMLGEVGLGGVLSSHYD